VWVAAGASRESHRGGTLRIVGAGGPDHIDPAIAYSAMAWSILSLTNDGLVALERTGGVAGSRIVPDLAVSVPKPTDGGKTYTFQLRPGIAYSDGEPVAASDFRRAFERIYMAATEEDVLPVPLEIVGTEDCAKQMGGPCDLSKGIVADATAGTVTFHLTSPDPDFLLKLALPFAVSVPPSVGDKEVVTPIPATGAYAVASYTSSEIRLARNPRFHEWSRLARPDGYPDEIVFTIGPKADEQLDMILAGSADASIGGGDNRPDNARLDQLQLQNPGIVHGWVLGTVLFFMDPEKPPFDNVDVRRAVNFAVDRGKVVDLLGGQARADVTCQTMPPTLLGSRPYCPYTLDPNPSGTWTAPDLVTARDLMAKSGRAGAPVSIAAFGPFDGAAAYLVDVLDGLGLKATLLGPAEDPNNPPPFDAVLTGWIPDYPAASAAIVPVFGCREGANLAHFCDQGVESAIKHALDLQETDPAAAGDAWAAVDRAIVDLAPAAPLAHRRGFDIVSDRLGNYQHHPEWLVLFDQLWVR
jgi:peptide/nickel transport system substrate-binding protein